MKLSGNWYNGERHMLKPVPALLWTLGAIAAVIVTASLVTTSLWILVSHSDHGAALASARLGAVRTGLAAGGGAGAAVGLMLAFRRQQHQEIATVLTDLDATERRVTELYGRATEQLGSNKAPVRLAGLYALERLGQDNQGHRQTIINVICAYLRMPFDAPPGASKRRGRSPTEHSSGDKMREDSALDVSQDSYEELQVRLTAQSILAEHLNPRPWDLQMNDVPNNDEALLNRFWDGIKVDLTGATLIDFNLARCNLVESTFHRATFIGDTAFSGATFKRSVNFNDTKFNGKTYFRFSHFEGMTVFVNATFDYIDLSGVDFTEATFGLLTNFKSARFADSVYFKNVAFNGEVMFEQTAFGRAIFDGAKFCGKPRGPKFMPSGIATFKGATFEKSVDFEGATVEHAHDDDNLGEWPAGWMVEQGSDGIGRVVRVTDIPIRRWPKGSRPA
jgi:uncharacterized protein YjbI with pentapeptide repeats